MTPNELLTPRYECIAPYPDMFDINIGDVLHGEPPDITTSPQGQQGYFRLYPCGDIDKIFHFDKRLSAFPANFRAMHWSEGRAVEDMPEYVKFKEGDVYKVPNWELDTKCGFCFYTEEIGDYIFIYSDIPGNDFVCQNVLPATLSEYEAYQKSKTI